jgi:TetR/AcrR family transcriptional regulator, cholesterol catabolism regulator
MSTRLNNRRRQIEDAASTLFSGRGYAATSMRDIAGSLDLQGGSLYAHVASKEALLWSIVDDAARRFHAAVRPIADGAGGAAERLRAMVHAHVGVLADGLERASVYLYEWTFLAPERRELVAASRSAYQAMFERVIAEGQASGELAGDHDPKLAAIFVLSAVNALPRWYRPDGPLSLDQVAERYADLFLRGLTAPPPLPPATGATTTPPPSHRRGP